MAQNITLLGASYSAVPAVLLPKTGGGTARFTDVTPTTASDSDVASGKVYFKADGSQSTGTASGGGSGKEVKVYPGTASVQTTTYTATAVKVTISKTGTYNIYYMGWRSSTSGTSGSEVYRTRNGTDTMIGSAHTSFTNSYGHYVSVTSQSLQAGDVITIYARARNTSSYMVVGNLIVQEV